MTYGRPLSQNWRRLNVSEKKGVSRRRRRREKEALRAESERVDRERIRARLDLPVDERLNFLRVRLPGGGSCL
jgi:hypothetical protein